MTTVLSIENCAGTRPRNHLGRVKQNKSKHVCQCQTGPFFQIKSLKLPESSRSSQSQESQRCGTYTQLIGGRSPSPHHPKPITTTHHSRFTKTAHHPPSGPGFRPVSPLRSVPSIPPRPVGPNEFAASFGVVTDCDCGDSCTARIRFFLRCLWIDPKAPSAPPAVPGPTVDAARPKTRPAR